MKSNDGFGEFSFWFLDRRIDCLDNLGLCEDEAKKAEAEMGQKLQQLIEQFHQELHRQEVMETFSQNNVNRAFDVFMRKVEELLKG